MNPIRKIHEQGQSLWYDNIRRGLIDSGELATLIAEGITGITSNPTIFEKAIDGSKDYDRAIRHLAPQNLTVDQLYDALVIDDIGRGADLLRPVYDTTHGADGYISIEVPPTLAEDTQATIDEAHRLFTALSRPNIMIKVPATREGIPAIRQLISDGLNVNVTLIFSLTAYSDVIEAYLSGLEERVQRGLPIDRIASVASFFVSRVDTLVDRLIDEKNLPKDLKGQAAIANAKLAYQLFVQKFGAERFAKLKEKGAMVQRPLWASTSTKNPDYPDLLYVESLIGPDTVDTLPPATVDAIMDHGKAARTIDSDVDAAQRILDKLESHHISMSEVTAQLLQEGVKSFHQSFVTLRESLEKKNHPHDITMGHFVLGQYQQGYQGTLDALDRDRAVPRLQEHDATLWSEEEAHQKIITHALGWMDVATQVLEDVPNLQRFFNEAVLDGFTDAVILGMGGSSLVSDVLIHSFSKGTPGLNLHVLDTTNASAIETLKNHLPLDHTLFIVASKSGTTTEPNAFYHYFWAVLSAKGIDPASHFIAITDPDTLMHREAEKKGFRHIFLNPADIGGRYSALSWFGMVPATLYGLNVGSLLRHAEAMANASTEPTSAENPGVLLGAALGALAKAGRDKVTLVMPNEISHLGDWLEQLLAESTGKLGTGLIPIAHEPAYAPNSYSSDRVFVIYQWKDQAPLLGVDALKNAGHPVITYTIQDPYQIAEEFYRWEIATAIAGAVLHIDAFDQPNVQESKDNTKEILSQLDGGHLPKESLNTSGHLQWTASSQIQAQSLPEALKQLLKLSTTSTYVAVMAYLNPSPELDSVLHAMRQRITEAVGAPTTLGYGPRFLHSTGQLHKGGPASGLFIQLVASTGPQLIVPGDGYDFMTLMHAQALGDFKSLVSHGRTVIRILVPEDQVGAVQDITSLV